MRGTAFSRMDFGAMSEVGPITERRRASSVRIISIDILVSKFTKQATLANGFGAKINCTREDKIHFIVQRIKKLLNIKYFIINL
jgi:hypothetical protein